MGPKAVRLRRCLPRLDELKVIKTALALFRVSATLRGKAIGAASVSTTSWSTARRRVHVLVTEMDTESGHQLSAASRWSSARRSGGPHGCSRRSHGHSVTEGDDAPLTRFAMRHRDVPCETRGTARLRDLAPHETAAQERLQLDWATCASDREGQLRVYTIQKGSESGRLVGMESMVRGSIRAGMIRSHSHRRREETGLIVPWTLGCSSVVKDDGADVPAISTHLSVNRRETRQQATLSTTCARAREDRHVRVICQRDHETVAMAGAETPLEIRPWKSLGVCSRSTISARGSRACRI